MASSGGRMDSDLDPDPGKDFFISYSTVDLSWAQWIAVQLERANHTTVLQAWDFRPGTNFVHEMQAAATTAERTIAVLSPPISCLSSARRSGGWRSPGTRLGGSAG